MLQLTSLNLPAEKTWSFGCDAASHGVPKSSLSASSIKKLPMLGLLHHSLLEPSPQLPIEADPAKSYSKATASIAVCAGVRLVIPCEDVQQLERAGFAEIDFRLHSAQIHTALPVPGIVQSTDPHITLISLQPRILLVENLLTSQESQASSQSPCVPFQLSASFVKIACTLG